MSQQTEPRRFTFDNELGSESRSINKEGEAKTVNDRITHGDLIGLGVVFLEQSEERDFLKRVNDEFAYLVGQEAMKWMKRTDDESGWQISG